MRIFMRILAIAAALLLIVAIVEMYNDYRSDPAQQEVLEERTFEEEIEDIEITIENSRVEVLPSTDGILSIVLSGNSDNFTLETDVSDSQLEIVVEDGSQFSIFGFNRSSSLQVFVPENELETFLVKSGNGVIQVEGMQAEEVMLETDNGRIELASIESGSVHAETNNGRIELRDIEADLSVRASNGRLAFTDVSGELQARANNGRIDVTVETLDFPMDLETNNGRINIETESEPVNARIETSVDNGRIDVYGLRNEQSIFGDGDVLIQLATNNGRIVVE